MSFIQNLSNICAKWLASNVKNELYDTVEDQIEVYSYGFQVIVGALTKGILLVSISYLLGVLIPAIIITLTFASFRVLAGGYHMASYSKCISLSLTLFLGSAYLAQHTYQALTTQNLFYLTLACLTLGVYIIYKYVPKDTPNKPITDEIEIKKFKKWSYTYLVVWTFVIILCFILNFKLILLSSCLGFILNLTFIIPLGVYLYSKLDNSTLITLKQI